MKENFPDELKQWAEEVITKVTCFAKKLDKDFYPLQSEILLNPDILFLGLNPGGGYTYISQKENPQWEFENGKMTIERLLKGNPDFDINSNNWKYLKGLKRIGIFDTVLNSGNFLMANYYYLSTANFAEVGKEHEKVLQICKELTLKLINLVKPKIIIVLGTSTGIDNFPFDKSTIINGHHQRLLISAQFNSIPIYAIPHPSTMAITHKEAEAIDINIQEILLNKSELTNFKFEKKRINVDVDKLNDLLKDHNLKFVKYQDKELSKIYELQIKGIKNDILDFRLSLKDKYISFRSFSKEKDFFNHLDGKEIYIKNFYNAEAYTNGWLMYSSFENYLDEVEIIENQIAKNIINLLTIIKLNNK